MFEDLDPTVDKAITRVFLTYTEWYMMLRLDEHDNESLAKLEVTGRTLILAMKTFEPVSGPLSNVSHDVV